MSDIVRRVVLDMNQIVGAGRPVRPSDPDDEIFLIRALDGAADYLVSEDRHLLDLKNSYRRPQIDKCQNVVAILCP